MSMTEKFIKSEQGSSQNHCTVLESQKNKLCTPGEVVIHWPRMTSVVNVEKKTAVNKCSSLGNSKKQNKKTRK